MSDDRPAGAAVVLSAVADVYARFADLCVWLRKQPGIVRVSHPVHLSRNRPDYPDDIRDPAAPGFTVEWYADLRHESGLDLDFILEVSYADGEWLIESSARAAGNDRYGDDLLVAFPDRHAVTDQEFLAELDGACRMLLDNREMILERFRTDYVGR